MFCRGVRDICKISENIETLILDIVEIKYWKISIDFYFTDIDIRGVGVLQLSNFWYLLEMPGSSLNRMIETSVDTWYYKFD